MSNLPFNMNPVPKSSLKLTTTATGTVLIEHPHIGKSSLLALTPYDASIVASYPTMDVVSTTSVVGILGIKSLSAGISELI